MPINLSVIICTYRPKQNIFASVLAAVSSLITDGLGEWECVVVDNNSPEPIEQLPYVQDFLRRVPQARVVREIRQGLTYARLAGIFATSGAVVVFFDDDNAPAPDYLLAASAAFTAYPHVAAFGPGRIEVQFVDPVPRWVEGASRQHFQERNVRRVVYACLPKWDWYYPQGTGLCCRRSVLEQYAAGVQQGKYTSADRSGDSMGSAGDVQIVFTAIGEGHAAGLSPAMKLRHLIPANRTTSRYLSRQMFGCGDGLVARNEVFPDLASTLQPVSFFRFARYATFRTLRSVLVGTPQLLRIEIAGYLGDADGINRVLVRPQPIWLKWARRVIGV